MMLANDNPDELTREELAGAWCVRLAREPLSPEERAEFEAWLDGDPANSIAYDKALSVWHGSHAVGETPEIISYRADALDALRRANRRRWPGTLNLRWPALAATAASLALALTLGGTLLRDRAQEYATGLGERRSVMLVDGSRLSLDAETQVAVAYEDGRRELRLLSGRAKFEVAKDPSRPFTVSAGGRTVIATGTAFSVELVRNELHVIVYEGHVSVVRGNLDSPSEMRRLLTSRDAGTTAISPGNELVASLDAAAAQTVQPNVSNSLVWEGGQLDFIDEPLASAIERLNRYNRQKLVLDDPRMGTIPINGVFNAGDSEAFVEALAELFPLRVRREGTSIILSRPAAAAKTM